MIPDRLWKSIRFDESEANAEIELSIVSIIKNEGPYIEEWVKYHILVGVEKFFLYDNESSDNTKKILQKYEKMGYVELSDLPGRAMQLPAYNDALEKHRYDTKYMAFIDADEFLFSCDKEKNVVDQVRNIFKENPSAGGIAVNWRMFGSSGFISKPKGGVLDSFLYRAKENGRGNNCIKTITNPRRVYSYDHVHYPIYLFGFYSVDENGNKVNGWSHPQNNIHKLRINHYFTKSKEEWIKRRRLGKADFEDRDQVIDL